MDGVAKDIFHDTVRRALEADGWVITEDPLTLKFGEQSVFVDLGAEAPMEAERAGQKIAVEVKSFVSVSPVTDLERALGQYLFYRVLLQNQRGNVPLYLALRATAYKRVFNSLDGQRLLSELKLSLLLFDETTERITEWIEPSTP